jgi:Ca2+ transporting ATPase
MILELEGGKRRLVNKGASEMVLAACNSYHSKTTGMHIIFTIYI